MPKQVQIRYFAILKEEAGLSVETFATEAQDLRSLYHELRRRFGFSLDPEWVRVAVDGTFTEMDARLESGCTVAYIPPVAGG